jgi:hypothetical protein
VVGVNRLRAMAWRRRWSIRIGGAGMAPRLRDALPGLRGAQKR